MAKTHPYDIGTSQADATSTLVEKQIDDPAAELERCLADLEARLEPEIEEPLLQQWIDFTYDRFDGPVFCPRRSRPVPPGVGWPRVSINAALEDLDLMALQQYGQCSEQLASASGLLLNVRANYGTSIIPLLYGVEPFLMDEETNTLPTSWPLNDVGAIRRILDAGMPELSIGYAPKVLAMAQRYRAIAERYPKVGRYVHIYHPDFQGPMDICEVVWGSTVFYALYDQPELVKALLELVTDTYMQFMKAWLDIASSSEAGNAHWGLYHRGGIMLRDDSAMNVSLDMFNEFIRPYDQRLLEVFGGGAIHFCGKGDHYAPAFPDIRGLYAINMSQPEYNDMEVIYRNTVDRGIKIIGLRRDAAEAAIARGRDLHGQVHAN